MKVSQTEYVKNVLKRFNIVDVKLVNVPLGGHFKLSEVQTPKTKDKKALMSKVLYASAVGILIYIMVCMRPDISQAVGYMSNPEKEH